MADNFRNKQWFKNLSQDRKDEICKKFDIDEKTLRKAGRETDDGRIVIDLLRLENFKHKPDFWYEANNVLKNCTNYKDKIDECETVTDMITVFKDLYNCFKEHSYLKYKESLHNDLLVKQTYKFVKKEFNYYVESIEESDKLYYAYKIYTHIRVLIESDLQLIKN